MQQKVLAASACCASQMPDQLVQHDLAVHGGLEDGAFLFKHGVQGYGVDQVPLWAMVGQAVPDRGCTLTELEAPVVE